MASFVPLFIKHAPNVFAAIVMAGNAPVIPAHIGTSTLPARGCVMARLRIRAVGSAPAVRLHFGTM